VTDRLGHDRRYAVDCSKAEAELGWRPTVAFEQGLVDTVEWYRANAPWVDRVRSGAYRSSAISHESLVTRHSSFVVRAS
jgi:dTDP-glucose 4,6-dehydratase